MTNFNVLSFKENIEQKRSFSLLMNQYIIDNKCIYKIINKIKKYYGIYNVCFIYDTIKLSTNIHKLFRFNKNENIITAIFETIKFNVIDIENNMMCLMNADTYDIYHDIPIPETQTGKDVVKHFTDDDNECILTIKGWGKQYEISFIS
jgi:translation elongation factor P/translation initiation factor 5A